MPLPAPEKLFAGSCDFVAGADSLGRIPEFTLPEIAFAGRSNVGKSSLINALTGRKALARTSNTPGRTQQLNFFDIGGQMLLVDMPGYGYAQVSKAQKANWEALIRTYLKGRPTLRCVFVLVDARHGLKDVDLEIMKMLDESAVAYRLVLTKGDKIKDGDKKKLFAAVEAELAKHPAAWPHPLLTSAEEKGGIDELREVAIHVALT
jgi:GTP-binding protein